MRIFICDISVEQTRDFDDGIEEIFIAEMGGRVSHSALHWFQAPAQCAGRRRRENGVAVPPPG